MNDDRPAGREANGPTIDEIVVGDPPEMWSRAGFDVAPDATVRVGTVRLRLTGALGAPGRGIESWALRDAGPGGDEEIDGLPTAVATQGAGVPPRPSHPNGATRIDHVVVMTPDLGRTTVAFERRGFDVRRVRDANAGTRPIRQVFFRSGEVLVEVVGPPEPPEAAEAAARPARFWGLAFRSADLDATKALLGDALDGPKDAVQPGRRIATLRLGAEGPSVAVAFMSPRP